MIFENLKVFYLFFLYGFIFLICFWYFKKKQLLIKNYFKKYNILTSSISTTKRKIKICLEILALTFITISLSNPRFGETLSSQTFNMNENLVIAIDVSNSMLTKDVTPDRLTMAKKAVSKIIDRHEVARAGVIVFSGSSSVISPLTTDKNILKLYVETISHNSVDTGGTDFESMFNLALDLFVRSTDSKAESSSLIIFSDGGITAKEKGYKHILDKFKKENVRIFSMAVGEKNNLPIPILDENNKVIDYIKDSEGMLVHSNRDDNILKNVSDYTFGKHWVLSFGNTEINDFLQNLNSKSFNKNLSKNYKYWFQYFAFFALTMMLIELIMNDIKKRR